MVATVMVAASIGALWLKWSLLPFNSWGWPADFGRAIAGLFAVGVVLAFAGTALSSPRLRFTMQVIAAFTLTAMLVIPVDVGHWLPAPKYRYRHDDRLVSLTAKPHIERGEFAHVLVLKSPDKSEPPIRINIWPELSAQLSRGNSVDVTLWRTRDVLLPGWRVEGHVPSWEDRLETIRLDGRMLYDARICPVHQVTMQRMELPLHYGFPLYDDAWEKFRGGPGFVEGGCVSSPQRTAIGYRCPQCAEQYQKWVAELTRKDAERNSGPYAP